VVDNKALRSRMLRRDRAMNGHSLDAVSGKKRDAKHA